MNERPTASDDPLKPENKIVEDILFGDLDDATLRKYGLNPKQVDDWSVSLFRGSIPEGFSSLEEFEEYILTAVESRLTKKKGPKRQV